MQSKTWGRSIQRIKRGRYLDPWYEDGCGGGARYTLRDIAMEEGVSVYTAQLKRRIKHRLRRYGQLSPQTPRLWSDYSAHIEIN